jgi:hypothetical protein
VNLQRAIRQVGKFTQDNSPLILTAVGAVGVVTTAYLSGQAGFKAALVLIEEDHKATQENPDAPPFTTKQVFNVTWKCYIPPAIAAVGTVAAIVTANKIGVRRAAAMTTALALSERALDEFGAKVVEKVGEKKATQIRDEIVQDRIDNDPLGDRQPIRTGEGQTLCYEFYAGRYFYSDVEAIRKAENQINWRFNNGHETASLSDFYELLGLEKTDVSEDVGWRADTSPLDINIVGHVSDKGEPCLGVIYRSTPIRDYWRFPG